MECSCVADVLGSDDGVEYYNVMYVQYNSLILYTRLIDKMWWRCTIRQKINPNIDYPFKCLNISKYLVYWNIKHSQIEM